MRFFIIPVGWITRHLRRSVEKMIGEDEVQSLENDFTSFINEVYDDTVGDLIAFVFIHFNKTLWGDIIMAVILLKSISASYTFLLSFFFHISGPHHSMVHRLKP